MTALTGRWTLVEARAYDAAGAEVAPPLGTKPRGLIQYEGDRMMVVVCDASEAGPLAGMPRAFTAYIGRYTLVDGILAVRVDGASSPAFESDQIRRIVFEGPDRYVAFPIAEDGQASGLRLTWQRLTQ